MYETITIYEEERLPLKFNASDALSIIHNGQVSLCEPKCEATISTATSFKYFLLTYSFVATETWDKNLPNRETVEYENVQRKSDSYGKHIQGRIKIKSIGMNFKRRMRKYNEYLCTQKSSHDEKNLKIRWKRCAKKCKNVIPQSKT